MKKKILPVASPHISKQLAYLRSGSRRKKCDGILWIVNEYIGAHPVNIYLNPPTSKTYSIFQKRFSNALEKVVAEQVRIRLYPSCDETLEEARNRFPGLKVYYPE